MERNFEEGFTDGEKEALSEVIQANPSLKNKLGSALDPEPGSAQDYANRAAKAQQEAQRAAGELQQLKKEPTCRSGA